MFRVSIAIALAACIAVPETADAQLATSREEQIVQASTAVLNEIMAVPMTRIPQSLLSGARGVAIVPNVLKGGFVVGVRHGRGVVLVRDEQGGWQPPQFVSLTGGSLGWQAGVQATDVILVFRTDKSVTNLMRGKFTIGVDAAAAAGPVGRQAAAATDATLQAEILSYSRSRGLFAGVSMDGSALQIDSAANQAFYRVAPVQALDATAPQIPASAAKLMSTLAQFTQEPRPAVVDVAPMPTAAGQPTPAPMPTTNPDAFKPQLAEASRQMSLLVDPAWQQFLALPAEIFAPTGHPSTEALNATLARFDRVAQDMRYRDLTTRQEFRSTHELLRRYQQSLSPQQPGTPNLPPPPID